MNGLIKTMLKGHKPAALVHAFLDDVASPDTFLTSFLFYLFENLYDFLEVDLDVNLALSDLESFASWKPEKINELDETLQSFVETFTGGTAPLLYASEHGYKAVVKLIISTEGAKVSTKTHDPDDPQPLSLAARRGHETIVDLLLTAEDIYPDHREESWGGQTALLSAAENGYDAVVKLLLAAPGVDPNTEDWSYQTPLLLASRNGHDTVVKLLLSEGLDPNFKNFWVRRLL
ncbi:ANK [Aspergillus sp. HF37]|nr:ANK [Aspergillus sp. HF37]